MKRKRTEPTQDQVAQTPIIHTIHHIICADKPRVKLWHSGFLIGIQAPPLFGKFSVWADQKLVGSSDEYGRFLFRDSQMPRAVAAVGPAQDYITCDALEIEFDHQTFYHMAAFCKGRDPVGNCFYSDIIFDDNINYKSDLKIRVAIMRRNVIMSYSPADPAECIKWAEGQPGIEAGLRFSL